MFWDGAGTGLFGLGGSILSYFGQASANESNEEIARMNNQFNAEQAALDREFQSSEAQKLRDWQEELSNTAYQRARKDLEAAGYNPLLVVGGSGASSPSGAQGHGSSASAVPYKNENALSAFANLGDVVSSALSAANAAKDLEIKESQKESVDANTTKTKVDTVADAVKGIAAPVASAYGAKKAADVAKGVLQRAPTYSSSPAGVEAASKFSSGATKAALNIGSKALNVLGYSGILGLGAGSAYMMKKAQDAARSAGRTSFTNHLSAGW